MNPLKLIAVCFLILVVHDELLAQDAGSGGGNIITIGPQIIRARVRRPTINLLPERMKPDFSQVSNSVESLNQQTKDRPKLDFYIRKDSEFPTLIEPEKVINKNRN